MNAFLYLVCAVLLLEFGFLVFRRIVARSYLIKCWLSRTASFLKFAVFFGFFSFPPRYLLC